MGAALPGLFSWMPLAVLSVCVLVTVTDDLMPAFPILRSVLGFSGMMLCFGGLQVP